MANNQEQPSYYAVIPADVRYSDVSSSAKLLFGEITALSTTEGYCWATNKYFADLYGVTDRAIRNWISELFDKGFIDVEIINQSQRRIFIAGGRKKSSGGVEKKFRTPPEKKFRHNNTRVNNTSNIDTNVSMALSEPVDNRKSDINDMFEEWSAIVGTPIISKVTANRRACSNLLRNKQVGRTRLVQLIRGVAAAQGDRYAPRISDFCTLQSRLNELITWGNNKRTTAPKVVHL